MKRLGLIAMLGVSAALLASSVSSDAQACGGCFHLPNETTVVSGHRMAFSISPEQTILWDQIQYEGDPSDFAWVLPVRKGAYVQVASDAFFETLEAATQATVQGLTVNCADSGGSGFGCGSAMEAGDRALSAAEGGGSGPNVQVLHRGTVGPYFTETVSTMVPGALNDWLTNSGYNVDPSSQPIIDAYVAEGFDFIALKLQPDKGVREMKPVRVVSPGASPTLPLRMVAIGTGATVAITLYVIGEGRWEADNFANAVLPADLLAWDFASNKSNYAELRKQTLAGTEGGKSWLTSFAVQGALLTPLQSPVSSFFGPGTVIFGASPDGQPLDTIAEGFLNQGILNKETAIPADAMNPVLLDENECRNRFFGLESFEALSGAMVENSCGMSLPLYSSLCPAAAPNNIDARQFSCGALDDLAMALVGTHPKDVWVTRLEAELPREHLATDLTLRPAEKQDAISNFMRARIAVNAETQCGSIAAPTVWSTPSKPQGTQAFIALSLFGIGLLAAFRKLTKNQELSSVQRAAKPE